MLLLLPLPSVPFSGVWKGLEERVKLTFRTYKRLLRTDKQPYSELLVAACNRFCGLWATSWLLTRLREARPRSRAPNSAVSPLFSHPTILGASKRPRLLTIPVLQENHPWYRQGKKNPQNSKQGAECGVERQEVRYLLLGRELAARASHNEGEGPRPRIRTTALPLLALIHRSAWKVDSRNFALGSGTRR